MTAAERLRLAELLLDRDDAFGRVALAEAEIARLLPGVNFPLPTPPELPSARKRTKLKAKASKSKTAPGANEEFILPPLLDGEDAWLLRWRDAAGLDGQSPVASAAAVKAMLLARQPQILSLATCRFDGEAIEVARELRQFEN